MAIVNVLVVTGWFTAVFAINGNNVCLSCNHVTSPDKCTKVVNCDDNEECYAEKFVGNLGKSYFMLGCRERSICVGPAFGKRSVEYNDIGDISICFECCTGRNACNINVCTPKALNISDRNMCFRCDNIEHPNLCRNVELCNHGEVCSIIQNAYTYSSGCKRKDLCHYTDFESCCQSNFCNNYKPCNIEITEKPVLGVPYEEYGVQKFNCTFKSMTNRLDVSYKVSWMIDGKPLYNEKGPIVYIASYEKIGYLDIDTLKGNLNKMLRCKVQAFCDHEMVVGGKAVQSNPYWVGVRVSPQTISKHRETVRIETTIPMVSTDLTKPLPVLQLQTQDITSYTCSYQFQYDSNTRQYYVDIPVILTPHSFPILRDKLQFKPMRDIYFHPWLNFQIPPVQTESFVNPGRIKQCVVTGDTIKVFDDTSSNLSMHNTMEPEIVLYKRDSSPFLYKRDSPPFLQVHIIREACKRRMCTCAVVVKEGNSGLQIDVCGQTTDLVPIVTYLSNTSQEEISLTPSKDSLKILVTTLTGSNVTVNMTGPDNEMGVTLSLRERNVGKPGGVCGNATWLNVPGIGNVGSVGGVAVSEKEYLHKWSVPQAAASLLNTTLTYDPTLQTNVTECSCVNVNEVECDTTL